jgi:hypothetical protein
LLGDPGKGLLLRLRQRVAVRHEVIRRLFQCAMELHGRGIDQLNQPALMKLLSRPCLLRAGRLRSQPAM